MKNLVLTGLAIVLFVSCGSYNSIDSFYETHKNNNNVTAFRMPKFMLSSLGNIVPEMSSVLSNVKDLRYIQLNAKTDAESRTINSKINNITTSNFTEIFRKNEDPVRTLITIRERKDVVKEIIYYSKNDKRNGIFYLNGNFNPIEVRKLAKEQKFDSLLNTLTKQYKWTTPNTLPVSN